MPTLAMRPRDFHCNPVVLGEPGVGKTAIGEGVARAIVTGARKALKPITFPDPPR